jgi:hypothetical protein
MGCAGINNSSAHVRREKRHGSRLAGFAMASAHGLLRGFNVGLDSQSRHSLQRMDESLGDRRALRVGRSEILHWNAGTTLATEKAP